MKKIITALLLMASMLTCWAEEPVGRLFRFERSTNKNYICYDVREKDGALDMSNPIHPYWILPASGKHEELSYLEKKLAFGYKVIKKGNNEVTIYLVPQSKLHIRICKRDGKWIALVHINGKEVLLTKMFAQMHSPNSLRCDYVDVFGMDDGKVVKERIMNK